MRATYWLTADERHTPRAVTAVEEEDKGAAAGGQWILKNHALPEWLGT
jgi:hypothetical protein